MHSSTTSSATSSAPAVAYLQEQQGFTVKPDMPGLTGSEVEALYVSGRRWLREVPLDR